MAKTEASDNYFRIYVDSEDVSLGITSPMWETLRLEPLLCEIQVNDRFYQPTEVYANKSDEEGLTLTWNFPEIQFSLVQKVAFLSDGKLLMKSDLINNSGEISTLNSLSLLRLKSPGVLRFGNEHEKSLIYEEGGYWAHVRQLNSLCSFNQEATGRSQFCWEVYNPIDRAALLIGYMTFRRWLGVVKINYKQGDGITEFIVGFDGGDFPVEPKSVIHLEEVIFMLGRDPWLLLEKFGDLIKEKHGIKTLNAPPVSWCSWYPYRHDVTEEDILENAKIAAGRLKALGLKYVKVDLGWQKNFLPSSYEENERFFHGLKWLSEELNKLGFNLGIWIAPFTISEFDYVYRDHPEWLLGDEREKPSSYGAWFWKPYGKIYALDLTHPDAQEYLRKNVKLLAEKGAKYFKLDFIGGPCNPSLRRRHNPRIVAGGGVEAVRLGSRIIAETVKSVNPDSIILNCNPYEVCGLGYFDLLYTCNDTGNTGVIPWSTMKENYTTVACHLWKNHRLGIIEPSCLCVGLPGTLEEARIRATVAFLSGGEIDISDDLTTLPEDRWQILLSVLPPAPKSAKPLDLFEPIPVKTFAYSEGFKEVMSNELEENSGKRASRVWIMPIEADWDQWILLSLFLWEEPLKRQLKNIEENKIALFEIKWERLGLDPGERYWIYEFWSGQFLGEVPTHYERTKVYLHPGNLKTLLLSSQKDLLRVAFSGPSVKLLAIRKARKHPWVVGTSFHITSGLDLKKVSWDEARGELSGEIWRPRGQSGFIVITGVNNKSIVAKVAGDIAPIIPSSKGSIKVPVVTRDDVTRWTITVADGNPTVKNL
ncbi:MAG: alpha-galactosidase [Candidatus Bathyarchaeia archaeon]